MSVQTLTYETRTARKQYDCESSHYVKEWILEGMYVEGKNVNGKYVRGKVEFGDLRKIVAARKEKFKIPKGSKYNYQRNIYDGYISTFRSRLDMLDIASKYDLFPEL